MHQKKCVPERQRLYEQRKKESFSTLWMVVETFLRGIVSLAKGEGGEEEREKRKLKSLQVGK